MKLIFFLLLIVLFSCEDKHTKDTEENTYYSNYLKIHESYDSVGPEKTIEALNNYLEEFPNAQNAYIFKAWVLANDNQVNKIDDVFLQALVLDSTNVRVYQYWASLLLKDSTRVNDAKRINDIGFLFSPNDLILENNKSWILLFENKREEAFTNAVNLIKKDTVNNYIFYRTAAIASKSMEKDSLANYFLSQSLSFGQKDSTELEAYINQKETVFNLYKKLK